MIDLKQYLVSRQVAEAMQCSTKYVNTLRKRGDLPAFPIGGTYRYDPDDVDRLVRKLKKEKAA